MSGFRVIAARDAQVYVEEDDDGELYLVVEGSGEKVLIVGTPDEIDDFTGNLSHAASTLAMQ